MLFRKIFFLLLILAFAANLHAFSEAPVTIWTDRAFSVLNSVEDAAASSLGLSDPMMQDDYNMFFNPAQIVNYGTIWLEVAPPLGGTIFNNGAAGAANGNAQNLVNPATTAWIGSSVAISPMLKIGAFIGRPYQGIVNTRFQNQTIAGPRILTPTMNNIINYGGNFNNPGPLFMTTTESYGSNLAQLLTPDNHVDIIAGLNLGSIALGLKFTYADNSENLSSEVVQISNIQPAGTSERTRYTSDHHITVGVLFKEFGPFKSFDVAFDLGLFTFKNEYKQTTISNRMADYLLESDASPSIGITVRPIMTLGSSTLIIPVSLNLLDASSKASRRINVNADTDFNDTFAGVNEVSDEVKIEDKTTLFNVSAALHTKPVEKLKVIYAVGFDMSDRTITGTIDATNGSAMAGAPNLVSEKSTETIIKVPISIAMEFQAWSWLAARLSISKLFIASDKIEGTDKQYNRAELRNTTTIKKDGPRTASTIIIKGGIGIKPAEKMDVDLALGAGLVAMPNMNGNPVPIPLVSVLSVKYHF